MGVLSNFGAFKHLKRTGTVQVILLALGFYSLRVLQKIYKEEKI